MAKKGKKIYIYDKPTKEPKAYSFGTGYENDEPVQVSDTPFSFGTGYENDEPVQVFGADKASGSLYDTLKTPAPYNNPNAAATAAAANVINKANAYDNYVKAGYKPSETVNYWKNEADSRYDAVKDYAPYNNPNAAAMQAAMDAIVSRPAFSFSADGDALYEQYKNNYINAGKRAMEDTMGAAASLSGGYGNSYAAAAGAQAYNDYISHINDIVPTLYNMALQKYDTEGDRLKTNYSIYADQDERDYGRWSAERENNYALLDAANGRYSGEQNTDIALWQNRGANLVNAYNMAQGIYGNAADAEQFRINTAKAIEDTKTLGAYGYDTSYMGTKQNQDIRQGEQTIKIGDQEIEMNGLNIEQKKRLGEIQDAVDKWTYTKDPSGFKALGWDTTSLEYYSGIEKQTAALSMYDATGNVDYLTEAGIDPTNLEQARKTALAVENYKITGDPQYLTDAGLNAAYIIDANEKEDAVFKAQYNDFSGLAALGVNTDFLTKMRNAEIAGAQAEVEGAQIKNAEALRQAGDYSGYEALGIDTTDMKFRDGLEMAAYIYANTGDPSLLNRYGISTINKDLPQIIENALNTHDYSELGRYMDVSRLEAYDAIGIEQEIAKLAGQELANEEAAIDVAYKPKLYDAQLYSAYTSGSGSSGGGRSYSSGGADATETSMTWEKMSKSDQNILTKYAKEHNFGAIIDEIVRLEEDGGDYSEVLDYIGKMYDYDFEPWLDGYEIKNDWNTTASFEGRPVYVNSQGLIWDIQKKRILDKYGNVIRENYTGTVLKKPGDLGGGTMTNQTK